MPKELKTERVSLLFTRSEIKRINAFQRAHKLRRTEMFRHAILHQVEVWEHNDKPKPQFASNAV